MMKIKTNEKYPIESQRNKEIHVPKEVGTVAVWRGEATEVKFRNAGERLRALSEECAIVQPTARTDWTINAGSASGEVHILGRCSNTTCPVIRYSGPPKPFNTFSTHGQKSRVFDPAVEVVIAHACGKGAEKIPSDVLKRYAAAKADEKEFYTPDVVEMYKMQTHIGQDNKHREVK